MNRILITLLIIMSVTIIAGGIFTYRLIVKDKQIKTTYDPGDEFVTNLKESKGYIKVDIILEISDKNRLKYMSQHNYKIRDSILSVLRSIDAKDLSNNKFMDDLKSSIIERLNIDMGKKDFINVFFEELIVQ